MLLLNFSHPLTVTQRDEVETFLGQPIQKEWKEMPQFDHLIDFPTQIRELVDRVGLTTDEWQSMPILLNLPGFAPAAATLLAELHGRSGGFPAIIRLRPIEGSTPTQYEVAEIVNLQALRQSARKQRTENTKR